MPPLPSGKFVIGTNNTGEDVIEVTKKYVGGSDVVLILSAASNISWWKGICKGQWEMLSTQDSRRGPHTGHFPLSDLKDAGVYKAKTFGVHTWMYPLLVDGDFQIGYEYHFKWVKD